MAANEYHFITHWRVRGTVEEVGRILGNATDLPRWWPSVYLDVHELAPADEHGVGREIDLYTKGWLPYTLRWQFTVTESRPDGFTLEARGDFDGRGIWTFAQDGEYVDVTYDWKILADKALLRRLSFIMKPIFAANHRWAMAKGEESLQLELQRVHTTTQAERDAVPAPPAATSFGFRPRRIPLLGAAIAGVAGVLFVARRVKRRRPS